MSLPENLRRVRDDFKKRYTSDLEMAAERYNFLDYIVGKGVDAGFESCYAQLEPVLREVQYDLKYLLISQMPETNATEDVLEVIEAFVDDNLAKLRSVLAESQEPKATGEVIETPPREGDSDDV